MRVSSKARAMQPGSLKRTSFRESKERLNKRDLQVLLQFIDIEQG